MLCYFSARASTCVISWIDNVLSEQVRCLMAITRPRVEYRTEGVMPITASTRAAPHSSGCICAGPDRSLAWDGNEWLPPFTGNYGCDCLRKVDLGTAGRGNPKYPAITMRETTSRALPCLAGRCHDRQAAVVRGPQRQRPLQAPGVRESRGLAYPWAGLAADLLPHQQISAGQES
jgi:hypothetical protein